MHRARIVLPLLFLLSSQLHAADLTKIERSICKEPAYQSKTPRYCLLVFGPEAKSRVWLVLDGKTLYVDRNGNGDLTDDGEKIAAKKGTDWLEEDLFEVDEIRPDERTHKNLTLSVRKVDNLAARDESLREAIARLPQGRGCSLSISVELPGWKGRGAGGRINQAAGLYDSHGFLMFADKPHDAPIIHFGGPWQMQSDTRNRLMVGQEGELVVSIGTRGLGAGTTAYLFYADTVPENVHPRVEITYPPAKPGEPPLKHLYELKERC
jgi:hypothetical protein